MIFLQFFKYFILFFFFVQLQVESNNTSQEIRSSLNLTTTLLR
jgi:hypothetical protein